MSILIAVRENNRTLVGSDGLITDGNGVICSYNTPKWNIIEDRAVGSAGIINISNCIHECSYEVLESPTKLIAYVKEYIEDNKWTYDTSYHAPHYGNFELGLVCEKGLYSIDGYLAYLKQDVITIGCFEIAKNMMFINRKMPLKKRITKAIEASINIYTSCGGEIYINEL